MDPVIIVSPHLDDAVLSCGQFLAGRPDAHLVTVFTGTPADPAMVTTFDRDSGFTSASEACIARAREDQIAAGFLAATYSHLGFVDCQYGGGEYNERLDMNVAQAIIDQVIEVADRGRLPFPIMFLGPAGLVHPDHHTCRRAVAAAAADLGDLVEFWLYEDLPARVLWPEAVPDALAWWRGMGWVPSADFPGTGPIETKAQAVRIYASQLWAPEFNAPGLHTVLVPERYYRMKKATL